MKRYLFLCSLFWAFNGIASEHDSLFQQGNVYYLKKHYDSAFILYEGLVLEGREDASLYYNFANTLFQLGRQAEALAWYEKAQTLEPHDADILQNLRATKAYLEIYGNHEATFLESISGSSLTPWAGIIFFWMALFLLLGGLLWSKPSRKPLWLVSAGIAVALALGSAWLIYNGAKSKYFVFVKEEALMYSQPSSLSTEIYEVSPGQKLPVLKKEQHWYFIQVAKNRRGWVHESHLIQQ
jgi:tetratricopeptide (TPR) repeat protein